MVGLFTVTAPPMVQVHTMAWSEPLFICLQLGGLLACFFYLRNRSRLSLILAAMTLACGVLVRYAGLATIAAGIIGILLLSQQQWRDRLFDVIIFAAIGFLPIVAWAGRNVWTAGSLTDRSFSIHRVSGEQLAAVFHVVSGWQSFSWLTPFDSTSFLLIALALAGAVWFSAAAGSTKSDLFPRGSYWFPAIIFFLIVASGYLVMLFASISFFDASLPVDTRLLSPLYIPLLVALSLLGGLWRRLPVSRFCAASIALCLMLALVAQAMTSLTWLEFSYYNGVGYADREWRHSATLAKLDTLPAANAVYSNAPDLLYVLRGMPAAMLPRKVDPHTLQPNQQFASELNRLKVKLSQDRTRLIFFYRVNWRWYLPGADEVEKAMDMAPFARERDGVIFGAH